MSLVPHIEHWGLEDAAFEDRRDPRLLVPVGSHAEAIARLTYLVTHSSRGLATVVGEAGSGKSLIAATLASRLGAPAYPVAYLPTARFSFAELLVDAMRQLTSDGIEPDTFDLYPLMRAFDAVCAELVATGARSIVWILDDADELDDDALRALRAVRTLGPLDGPHPLTILLVGDLPQLDDRLASLPAVEARIEERVQLEPLTPEEVGAFLIGRLQAAGHPSGELFAAGCAERLYEATDGNPRALCRLARLAMDNAYTQGFQEIPIEAVEEIVTDLFGEA